MNNKEKRPPKGIIRLVVCDIDGVLNASRMGRSIDLLSLHYLQELNIKAEKNQSIPFITINTGRSLPYTELFAQMLSIKNYFIFEFGAAIAKIHESQIIVKEHASFAMDRTQILNSFQSSIIASYPEMAQYFQRGKAYMTSFIFESYSVEIEKYGKIIAQYIKDQHYPFKLDIGHNFINILWPDLDKGTGIQLFLKENPQFSSSNLAGIGDSNSDWPFLSLCGFSGCPSNGSELLKTHCDYCATQEDVKGTIEIIDYIIAENRKKIK